MLVRRAWGFELVRDGGSLCATFEAETGRFALFFKIEIADLTPTTKERLGYGTPVLIDLDPAKRTRDTDTAIYSELSGPKSSISWREASGLLTHMAEVGPAPLTEREAALREQMIVVANHEGELPPGRDRTMHVRRPNQP